MRSSDPGGQAPEKVCLQQKGSQPTLYRCYLHGYRRDAIIKKQTHLTWANDSTRIVRPWINGSHTVASSVVIMLRLKGFPHKPFNDGLFQRPQGPEQLPVFIAAETRTLSQTAKFMSPETSPFPGLTLPFTYPQRHISTPTPLFGLLIHQLLSRKI